MPLFHDTSERQPLEIIYDGDCPVCSCLALKTRLDSRLELVLVDARNYPDVVNELHAQGIDLNESMVVRTGTATLSGAAALTYLESVSSSWGGLNFLRPLFSNPHLAVRVYPLLVKMRKMLLFLLGRKQIEA